MKDLQAKLRACAAKRRRARRRLEAAKAELRALRPELEDAILAAHAAGMSVAEIARSVGATRLTVYTIIRDRKEA